MRRLWWLLPMLLAACAERPTVTVSDAWVRPAPPAASATAAYMKLENRGDGEVVVQSVASPGIERLEIHETRMEDGVMRMRRLDSLSIQPGGTLELAPGGLHLMIFGDKLPVEGQTVPLVIRLADGRELRVDAAVRRDAP